MPNQDDNNHSSLAARFDMPALADISDDLIDPDLVANLPLEWTRKHVSLPVRYGGGLGVLIADPLDLEVPKYLALLFNRELTPILAEKQLILSAIERCYYRGAGTPADFMADLTSNESQVTATETTRADDLLQTNENAPVSRLLNLILLGAVKAAASDIHFEPFEKRLRVRYRIDGVLFDQTAPPKNMEAALTSRLKVMARMDISEKRLPQDGVARVRVGERELDIRISTIPVVEGERVVLRLLSRAETLHPLTGLGMPPEILNIFQTLTRETSGMIAVCGPTGSGKTTTLYAALQELDKAHANILTIEDPVEYQLPDIGQMQIKPKIGLGFAEGLRHILRQDPDVILVGEVRDRETAKIAVRSALTGHLMFTTLHTNDAPGAVLRWLDIGIEPYLLAAALRATIAQRLARRLCHNCRVPGILSSEEIDWLAQSGCRLTDHNIRRAGKGCAECVDGYRGRTGLFELLVMNQELAELVRSGRCDLASLRAAAERAGMRPLLNDGIAKLADGSTSPEELRRVAGQHAIASESKKTN